MNEILHSVKKGVYPSLEHQTLGGGDSMVNKQLEKQTKRTPQDLLENRGKTFEECYKKHRGLIGLVVTQYRNYIEVSRIDLDDLNQECSIALYEAFNKYDATLDIMFSTYAVKLVRGRALRYFRDRNELIRKPRAVQALEKFFREQEIKPSDDLTPYYPRLVELGISLKQLPHILISMQAFTDVTSMDALLRTSDGEDTTFSETVGFIDKSFGNIEVQELLNSLVLSNRDRQILQLHIEGYTQVEIGEAINLSQMHVSRLLRSIRKKVKHSHSIS